MATGDSAVLFDSKVCEYGLGDLHAEFVELGLYTANNLAFATGCLPGQGKEKICKDEIVLPVIGDATAPAQISVMRRLFTECYTLALDELKRKTERGDPEACVEGNCWVPSEANTADAPSRAEVGQLLAGGAVRVPPQLPSAVSLAGCAPRAAAGAGCGG
eukprot:3187600-Amphidinium_carterae.1